MLYSFESIYEITHGCVYEMEDFKSILHFFPDTLVPSSITTSPSLARETVQMKIQNFAWCQGERQ